MSTSSGLIPLALKSLSSSPQGVSGVGLGPRPVSTTMVRPSERTKKQARLKLTLCSGVRWFL